MKQTQFVTEVINDIEVLAYCEGFTLKLTQSTIFRHLDMCFALVQSSINETLEAIEDMESHYDYYDPSDWDEVHKDLDFAEKLLCDLGILQDLGTPRYADEDHYMESVITLLKKFNSQINAMNNDLPEFNRYYLDQLTKCITETCTFRHG